MTKFTFLPPGNVIMNPRVTALCSSKGKLQAHSVSNENISFKNMLKNRNIK